MALLNLRRNLQGMNRKMTNFLVTLWRKKVEKIGLDNQTLLIHSTSVFVKFLATFYEATLKLSGTLHEQFLS